jgi:hypothetical protein
MEKSKKVFKIKIETAKSISISYRLLEVVHVRSLQP